MGITMTPEQVRDYFVAVEERAKALTNATGKIPAEILLGVAEKYGDKLLSKHTLDRIIQLAVE